MPREMVGDELSALLKTFTQIQIEFVAARLVAKSDKEAAKTVGISPNTAYSWPNKDDVGRAVQLATLGSLEVAREKLSRLVLKAVQILDQEMDSGKKLAAACEVLDRAGLVARRELDVTSGGKAIEIAKILGQVVQMSEDEFTTFAGSLPDLESFGTLEETAEVEE